MLKRKRGLSYANVTATLALVFSMSGGALAANSYLINSTKQINPNVLKRLTGKSGPVGSTGDEGPQGQEGLLGQEGLPGQEGPRGEQGVPGEAGPEGQSALTPLQAGKTISGIVGGRFENGAAPNSPMGAVASFPVRAPTPLDDAHIQVASTANCTGTSENPTAAEGYVCIYPSVEVAASDIEADTGVASNDVWGFELEWLATKANGQSSVRASWAYTAP